MALFLLPGAIFVAVFLLRAFGRERFFGGFTLFDDSMISMTYARTLVETGELVWFPSAPRVQGFTNPLWTLVMAAVHQTGLRGSSAALVMGLLGAALLVGCALLVRRIVVAAAGPIDPRTTAIVAWIAAGSTLLLYPTMYWSLRGMEVGLLAFIVLLIVAGVVAALNHGLDDRRSRSGLGLAAAACVVGIATRLDFVIVALVAIAAVVRWSPDGRTRARVLVIMGLPVVVTSLAVLGLQRAYYGEWLPNTYRLKVEGIDLGDRLVRGLAASGKVLPIVVIVAFSLLVTGRFARTDEIGRIPFRISALLSAMFAATLLYNVWVGGDAWEWMVMTNRYLAVVCPAVVPVVAIAVVVGTTRGPVPQGLVVAFAAVLMASGFGAGLRTNPMSFDVEFGVVLALAALLFIIVNGLAIRREVGHRSSGFVRGHVAAVAFGLLLIGSALLPALAWVRDGGWDVRADAGNSELGVLLARVTDAQATVATFAAGAPAYYSDRRMVDLLGKSDRAIASTAPRGGSFHPGHDKWDFEYSIGELRPDVITDFSVRFDESRLDEWGYRRMCLTNGHEIVVLRESPHVRFAELTECQQGP